MAENRDPFSIPPRLLVNILQYLLPLLAIAVLFYYFPQISNLVVMLFLGLLVSYLFSPIVDRLERWNIERTAATAIVFLGLGGMLFWMLWVSIPEIGNQIAQLQDRVLERDLQALLNQWVQRLELWLPLIEEGQFGEPAEDWFRWILGQFATIQAIAQEILRFLGDFVLYLLLVPIFSFFLIRDRRELRKYVIQSFPNQYFEMVFNIYYKIDQKLGNYIRGLIVEIFIMALLSLIGFWLLDVPFAILNALFLGVTNVVPYFGPIAGALPPVVLTLLDTRDPYVIAGVILVACIVQLLDNVFVKPIVFSRSMDLHPVIVILVIIGGGQLYGVLGMILSIPVVSMIIVIVSEFNWAVRNFRFET